MTGSRTQLQNAKTGSGGMVIRDFEQFLQLLSNWDGTIEQLTCGRLQGSMKMAQGRQMHAHLAEANQSIMLRGRERSGICTFTLVLPASAACLWQRRRLDSGTLVVRSGNVEVDHRSSRNAINLSIAFPEATLLRSARSLTKADLKSVSWLASQPPPSLFSKLETSIRRFLHHSQGASFSKSQDSQVLEEECLNTLLDMILPSNQNHRSDLPLQSRTLLTSRADDIMRAHLQETMGEVELCEALQVSGRTLRLAFRERYGLGPMAYFQTLRLNAVRNQLIKADPESTSIAKVARELGFGHLGKFAGYYRRLFGELPSKTLARQRRSIPTNRTEFMSRNE